MTPPTIHREGRKIVDAVHMVSMTSSPLNIQPADLDLSTIIDQTMSNFLEEQKPGDGAKKWASFSPAEKELAARPMISLIWSMIVPVLEQVNAKIAAESFEEPTFTVPDTLEGLTG